MRNRFESKYTPEPNTGCWLWIGRVNEHGYGRFDVRGTSVGAHRISYELYVGEIPVGLELDHLCKVRGCVNPEHLEPVTHAENVRRGDSGKLQLARTHCPYGHPYSGDNLYVRPTGVRQCRACARINARKRREAK